MNPIFYALILAGSAFLVYLITHILQFRLFPPHDRMRALSRLIQLMVVPVVLIFAGITYTSQAQLDISLNNTNFSVLLSVIFFTVFHAATLAFYCAVDHSVRIRLTVELYLHRHKPVALDTLFKLYSPEEATRQRIAQLIHGGYALMPDQEHVLLTRKGQATAQFASVGRRFFNISDHDFTTTSSTS